MDDLRPDEVAASVCLGRKTDPSRCKHDNPNTLTADRPTSAIAQGPSVQTRLVGVARFEGDAPEVTAFMPPRIEPAPPS